MSDDFTHILEYRLWDIGNTPSCNMNLFVFNNYILEFISHKSPYDKLLKYAYKTGLQMSTYLKEIGVWSNKNIVHPCKWMKHCNQKYETTTKKEILSRIMTKGCTNNLKGQYYSLKLYRN